MLRSRSHSGQLQISYTTDTQDAQRKHTTLPRRVSSEQEDCVILPVSLLKQHDSELNCSSAAGHWRLDVKVSHICVSMLKCSTLQQKKYGGVGCLS